MKKILLVEDDKNISEAIVYHLKDYYNLDITYNLKETIEKITNYYDLAILDISLPDGTSFDFYEKLSCPIIFLTAHDEEEIIVKGLSIADDYITKPFKNKELHMRIEKILKRTNTKILEFDNLIMNLDSNKIMINNKEVEVTLLDFKILELLINNVGKIITRDKLSNLIYDHTGNFVEENTLNVYIKRIRDKLGIDFIKTIRKVGYIIEKK